MISRLAIEQRFPNASESFRKLNANPEAQDTGTAPVVERVAGNAALETRKAKVADSTRFLVRVTSVRVRLLDQDNLAEKYHVDCCRYAGILPDDNPEQTQIQVTQRRCLKGEAEKVIVEVFRLES
jgi:hypothetical protein